MSEWREAKNRQALTRLRKALPSIFPASVLTHALQKAFIPPTPRRTIDSYWRAHPLRADRLARTLARRTGAPDGWTWRLGSIDGKRDLPTSFRMPPAPFREQAMSRGPGFCQVCGQPAYAFGWHVDLWGRGPNLNARWHAACVAAWNLWTAPSDQIQLLKRLQKRRCAESGLRLRKTAEVDHRVPLFRVWREYRSVPWPALLDFWGVGNLQVINRDAHAAKCAAEAGFRSRISIEL
jgi:hypothetical protein